MTVLRVDRYSHTNRVTFHQLQVSPTEPFNAIWVDCLVVQGNLVLQLVLEILDNISLFSLYVLYFSKPKFCLCNFFKIRLLGDSLSSSIESLSFVLSPPNPVSL